MNTTTNQTAAISATPKRIILASAHRHERHSTGRQERALKTVRRMGRFEDNQMLEHCHVRRVSSIEETLDE